MKRKLNKFKLLELDGAGAAPYASRTRWYNEGCIDVKVGCAVRIANCFINRNALLSRRLLEGEYI